MLGESVAFVGSGRRGDGAGRVRALDWSTNFTFGSSWPVTSRRALRRSNSSLDFAAGREFVRSYQAFTMPPSLMLLPRRLFMTAGSAAGAAAVWVASSLSTRSSTLVRRRSINARLVAELPRPAC